MGGVSLDEPERGVSLSFSLGVFPYCVMCTMDGAFLGASLFIIKAHIAQQQSFSSPSHSAHMDAMFSPFHGRPGSLEIHVVMVEVRAA